MQVGAPSMGSVISCRGMDESRTKSVYLFAEAGWETLSQWYLLLPALKHMTVLCSIEHIPSTSFHYLCLTQLASVGDNARSPETELEASSSDHSHSLYFIPQESVNLTVKLARVHLPPKYLAPRLSAWNNGSLRTVTLQGGEFVWEGGRLCCNPRDCKGKSRTQRAASSFSIRRK